MPPGTCSYREEIHALVGPTGNLRNAFGISKLRRWREEDGRGLSPMPRLALLFFPEWTGERCGLHRDRRGAEIEG